MFRTSYAIGAWTLWAAACGTATSPPSTLPPDPYVAHTEMSDIDFRHDGAIPAGRVVFEGKNNGRLKHQITLFQLPENIPPIDEQLHGPDRLAVTPEALFPAVGPGEIGSFAVDLVPGRRYALLCTVTDEDGRSHAVKGMTLEFRTPQAEQSSSHHPDP